MTRNIRVEVLTGDFESVTAQFKRQLADLMMRINAADPHFVRCINPNSKKEAGKLEPEMILVWPQGRCVLCG